MQWSWLHPRTGRTPPSRRAARCRVKALVVNMFGLEAAPWLAALHPEQNIRVPGLARPGQAPEMPYVRCTAVGVCQLTTGMGHANAAASMMAVLYSGLFDFRLTYFSVAGIGGLPR